MPDVIMGDDAMRCANQKPRFLTTDVMGTKLASIDLLRRARVRQTSDLGRPGQQKEA
ncbi:MULTISPECIES: hypothetical protein [Caballeronia]|uniref:hypothetical protein n=1 Tax=Caballeronia TaxID=1827195 RepID=UPI00158E19D3|nr:MULTISPECIES: hypothetical protein [Caballeronia]MCG7402516.1 hypothetical protein [Caballeronia zhejiangensis]MCI1044360.1 hypothetical protein [Caballeronia zhejiangensis]